MFEYTPIRGHELGFGGFRQVSIGQGIAAACAMCPSKPSRVTRSR